MKKLQFLLMALCLNVLAMQTQEKQVYAIDDPDTNPTESLYGEWWLVGWNDKGIWLKVDTNYVSHQHLSVELKENDYVMAYSMVNEIFVGLLTLNGNEMIFDGEMRGFSTKVYGDVMENLFFEDHICDIKSYQIEGDLLRLYYTNDDYFLFTKDYDNSEEHYNEWKNGPVDPYIGEVIAVNDEEVEVKIIHSPSYVIFYSRTVPPMGNQEVCRFAASELADQPLEIGDKVTFRIVQFKRMKVEERETYQLKVEPCKGSGHITQRTGVMHNDKRMGWMIIDDEVNERQGGVYYYPLTLDENLLTEGLPVIFSGELYPTEMMPWDNKGLSDCYYLGIDAIESLHHTTIRSITTAKAEEPSEIYDMFGRRQTSIPIIGIYIQNGKKVSVNE